MGIILVTRIKSYRHNNLTAQTRLYTISCIQSSFGVLGKGAFREGTESGAERAQRDVCEKDVYCFIRPIGLNCLNLPKKSLKTNNSHHSLHPHGKLSRYPHRIL